MDDEVIKFENGIVGKLVHDQDCEPPYDDEDGSVRIVVLHNRYKDPSKGKCGKTPEEVAAWVKENGREWYVVNLWMYDHSGTVYRVGGDSNPFSCQWDSGRVGIIALRKADWGRGKYERNAKRLKYAEGVAEYYTQWANGECYGIIVETETGDLLDSCHGFIGHEHAVSELTSLANYYVKNKKAA